MKNLKGASPESLAREFVNRIAEKDRPIFDAIMDQIDRYEDWPPRIVRIGGVDEEAPRVHGFVEWIGMVQDGVAFLPDRIPRSVLVAWRDGYAESWGLDGEPWCPSPFWRCADCLMVLPHGRRGWSGPCPVCRSARIFHADFSRPLGEKWIDPRASYR